MVASTAVVVSQEGEGIGDVMSAPDADKTIVAADFDDTRVVFTLRSNDDGEIRTGKLSTGELWVLIWTRPATYDGKEAPRG